MMINWWIQGYSNLVKKKPKCEAWGAIEIPTREVCEPLQADSAGLSKAVCLSFPGSP
jgi:hypothetical protein